MAGINTTSIKRGYIWSTDLRPGVGREITKIRPALVISTNIINSSSATVVIVPISSQIPPMLGADRILVSQRQTGLAKESVILCGQIRAIDKARLKKKIGAIDKSTLEKVEQALQLILFKE